MPEGLNTYKSTLTPQEVDAALRNMGTIEDNVEKAAGYAQTAQQYGAIIQQNQPAIQAIKDNLSEIQGAAQNAQDAKNAEENAAAAASSASQSATDAEEAAKRAEQAANFDPNDYYNKNQLDAFVPFLYQATFYSYGWSGSAGNYTQSVSIFPVAEGPQVTSASQIVSVPMCQQTSVQSTNAARQAVLNLLNSGNLTLGSGTISATVWEQPQTTITVYFLIVKGGS